MPLQSVIRRGGSDTERLYLKDVHFPLSSGEMVVVQATNIPNVDMDDLIARHIGRYSLFGLFCRLDHRVLDFPCGSGYAADFLKTFSVVYHGLERDPVTVEYAKQVYGRSGVTFAVGDLCSPNLGDEAMYDVIGCIEGLEHIERKYQSPLIGSLKRVLKPGGTMVVSSPENPDGKSGKSSHNKDHLWELTRDGFLALLHQHFEPHQVELVTHKATLSTGIFTTCYYGICHLW